MDLATWSRLEEGERREKIRSWYLNGERSIYQRLAAEAARGLRRKLKKDTRIHHIDVRHGDLVYEGPPRRKMNELPWAACVPVLSVATILPASAALPEVPATYKGFEVQLINYQEQLDSFILTLKRILYELKGWSEERTMALVKEWEWDLSKPWDSVKLHYGPVKMALPFLLTEEVKRAAGERLQDLYNDIRTTIWMIEHKNSLAVLHPDTVEDYDWDRVRKRIAELTEQYTRAGDGTAPS